MGSSCCVRHLTLESIRPEFGKMASVFGRILAVNNKLEVLNLHENSFSPSELEKFFEMLSKN